MSAAKTFLKQLGLQVGNRLGDDYKFLSSKLELGRKNGPGFDVIVFAGSNKWSPSISVSFYVGRNFAAPRKLEKALGLFSPPCHVQQYSPSAPKMAGLGYSGPYTWAVDIQDPPKDLIDQISMAVRGIGEPFFERFREIEPARAALIDGDSWCFQAGGHYWHTLFTIDASTGNVDHFRTWMQDLEPLAQEQATERLAKLRESSNH